MIYFYTYNIFLINTIIKEEITIIADSDEQSSNKVPKKEIDPNKQSHQQIKENIYNCICNNIIPDLNFIWVNCGKVLHAWCNNKYKANEYLYTNVILLCNSGIQKIY